RLAGVQVGTAQVRLLSGAGWPARLYAVAAIAAGRAEAELPHYARDLESGAAAHPEAPPVAAVVREADGAASSRVAAWERPPPFVSGTGGNSDARRDGAEREDRRGFGRGVGRGAWRGRRPPRRGT
ncbi:MAG TPA: hypothetical protein VH916_11615, partial [Dehalococcoidia bacterium]